MIGKMNDSSFPIDVFPNKIRNIILNMYEYLAFPIDYTACSMMTAISTCIGNTHIVNKLSLYEEMLANMQGGIRHKPKSSVKL